MLGTCEEQIAFWENGNIENGIHIPDVVSKLIIGYIWKMQDW